MNRKLLQLIVRWLIGKLSHLTINNHIDLRDFEAKIFRLIGIPIGVCFTILALWMYGAATSYIARASQNITQQPIAVAPESHETSSVLNLTHSLPPAPLKKVKKSSTNIDSRSSYMGHLPYHEAASDKLLAVGTFTRGTFQREELLVQEAAEAFKDMRLAASSEGVKLMPISGFRTIANQAILFEEQVARKGGTIAASKFSAPAGYSEHHTGYAIDIGDTTQHDTDLKYAFSDTQAYRWLVGHARLYGFEQSFPENNAQGLSFEPWHWRFIGSLDAANTFKEAQYISRDS